MHTQIKRLSTHKLSFLIHLSLKMYMNMYINMYMNIIYDTEYSTASSSMVSQFSIIVVYDNLNNPLLETVSILPWPFKKKKKVVITHA